MMTKRWAFRQMYIAAWNTLDVEKLVASVTDDFSFDDPAELDLVTKATLPDYMRSWDERVKALGGTGEWALNDVVNQDQDGVLVCWEWWKCLGTSLQGAALVRTTDQGVLSERIVYYQRP